MKIDLNCDLGESFGAYTLGLDSEVIKYITSANIACGFHASDPVTMDKTVKLAAAAGVAVGAHPGYPDLVGFGRRNLAATPAEVRAYVKYQVGALAAFAASEGQSISHVKPHGAMYNMAAKDPALADAIAEAVQDCAPGAVRLALSGSEMVRAAARIGVPCAAEVFADRAYMPDGTLVPRSRPDAMIRDEDEAIARVIRMAKEGVVRSVDGTDVEIKADSVCVHGDGESALLFVQKIRAALKEAGVEVVPIREVLGL